eukprot:12820016-Prorocentrum_lima.AAC.1
MLHQVPASRGKSETVKIERAKVVTPLKPEIQSDDEEQYNSPQQGSIYDSLLAAFSISAFDGAF